VAVLTAKVQYLTEHVKRNRNDLHSRRGLEILVAQRRRLLKYLRAQSTQRYGVLVRKLGIRAL
jgi:small subunit ribosomal protein S15